MDALPPQTPAVAVVSEIVVTGRPLPLSIGAAAYSSLTITPERLASTASGRLEDALRDIAGLTSFRRTDSRSANPTSQGLTLRALGGNAASRALVLLDGVPIADPFAGYLPFAAIDPARLASARITRGGGGGGFGSGAVAGTLDLTSAGPDQLAPVTISAAYGSRDSLEGIAGIAVPVGGGFVTASLRQDEGDGYILTPEDQRGTVDIPARYASTGGSLRAVVPAGEDTELQASFRAFTDSRTRGVSIITSSTEGADASLRMVHRGPWQIDALAFVQTRNFTSSFAAINADRSVATPSLDQFKTPATGLGARLEVRPPLPDSSGIDLQFGLDWRQNSGTTNERFRFIAGEFTSLREAGGTTSLVGAYAEASMQASPILTLTAGARLDRWNIAEGRVIESVIGAGQVISSLVTAPRSGTRATARGGLVLKPVATLGLRAAVYSGFRLPTPNELYRSFRVGADATAANPDLEPETARGVEAGLDWQPIPTARVSLTAFWNSLDGAISNVTLARGPGVFPLVGFVSAAGSYRQRTNLDSIRTQGLEMDASLQAGAFTGTVSAAYADARVRASGPAQSLDGLRPAQSPTTSVSATLAYAAGPVGLSATVRHLASAFEDDQNLRRLPSATTLDASARFNLTSNIAITARAENLTDTQIISGIANNGTLDLAQPRTLWIGLSFSG
jgi:outer membrane receptor protein involved in Fe transport